MSVNPSLSETLQPDGTQPSDGAAAYVVGYGRPPVHTRFKPGQSGNSRGRPKRQRNVRTVVEEALNQRITVREGNRTRSITKLDAVILTIVDGALKRDAKTLVSLLALLRAVGMTAEAPAATHREPVTSDDDAILADFLVRHGTGQEQAEPTKPDANPPSAAAKPVNGRTTS